MKVIDLRSSKKTDIGSVNETSGDKSLLCITTAKGYRLVMDRYDMKRIADYYIKEVEDEI